MMVRVFVDLIGGQTREFVQSWRDDRTLTEIRDYLWLRVIDGEQDDGGLVTFDAFDGTDPTGTFRTKAVTGITVAREAEAKTDG